MELAGNEKKIQALFRELKLEDESVVPGFVRLWNRAQATSRKPRRAFKTSFALATGLLVITLCSLAYWSRNWQRSQPQNSTVAVRSTTPGSTPARPPATPEPKQLVPNKAPDRIRANRPRRLTNPKLETRNSEPETTHRQAQLTFRNATLREAVAISSWQSPTATLMQSPADDVLTKLPQLDRSVTEFKSFLPNTPK